MAAGTSLCATGSTVNELPGEVRPLKPSYPYSHDPNYQNAPGTGSSVIARPPIYGPFPGDVVGDLIGAAAGKLIRKFFSEPTDFGENDRKNIEHLIREGQRQGLEELEIRISKDLGAKIELSAQIPLELPVGATIHVNRANKADYVIHVKYGIGKIRQDIEALRELDKLRQEGILTNEEFMIKKKEILGTEDSIPK